MPVIKAPKQVKRGDVMIYSLSQMGIAETDLDKNGVFTAIEGNTNAAGDRKGGAVLRKSRKLDGLRSLVRA
ncbi:hypothetical protein [Luteolibacter flavescens]|uniref:hypothetical protein n=1 Tax=Luteolibacter flavescens TaxID=1859460 RepID=UPI002221E3A4|nr:hypothetical protein [Luteolibacter flavescens]